MRKLPVQAAFTHAVRSTWNNLPFAFHASWPWLALFIPFSLYFDRAPLDFDPMTTDPVKQAEMAREVLVFYATALVGMVVYASIGVSWHRYILKDEVPQGTARLRLDRTVWRYVGNTILIALLVAFSILPFALIFSVVLAGLGKGPEALLPIYIGLAFLIAMPVTYRFSLKLPAIAVGNQQFRFGDAWNTTRGNMVRLALLGGLSFIMISIAGVILGLAEQGAQALMGPFVVWIFAVLRQIIAWVVAVFAITTLTSLYGFFVENREF